MVNKFYKSIVVFFLFAGLMFFGITAHGQIISTIAGNGFGTGAPNDGAYAGDGGQATAAEFNGPWGVALDDSGNVYIGDVYNNVIRKITTSTGIITTIAGNNTYGFNGDGIAATTAQLEYPQDLAVDTAGNVYFADLYNGRIRKITKATGIISTIAGDGTWGYSGDGGAATNAEIYLPYTVAVDDSGNVYVADTYNNRVRKVSQTTGIITTIAGTGTLGYTGDGAQATAAELNQPYGVALDDSDNIYIADSKNNVIRKVTAITGIINTIAGNYISGAGYAGDNGAATAAELNSPLDIAVDGSGNLYISDQYNNRIRKVSAGIITTFAGNGTPGYNGDGGLADTSEIQYSEGVAVDKCGNVYIGDYYNQRIRKVTLVSDSISVNTTLATISCGSPDTLKVSGASTYIWTPSAGLSDTTGSIVIASPTFTTTYTVTGYTTCLGATPPKTVVVIVNPTPSLIIQPPSPASVCLGQSIILSVPISGTGYTWSPSKTLNSSMGDTVTATPAATITYTVTGTDSLGCPVSGLEEVDVNTGPSKPTISQHDSVLISSSTQSNQWLRNDTALQGATNQDYVVTTQGYYQVTVSNPANGCSTTSDSVYVKLSGINKLTVESGQLTVYPNPTSGEIIVNISSSVGEIKNWHLQITDVLGRTVYTKSSLNYSNEIDLSDLSDCMYFISVINKTGRVVVPVVKQN